MLDNQITFRLTATDTANVLAIATSLRDRMGRPFVTLSDAVRYALTIAAQAMSEASEASPVAVC